MGPLTAPPPHVTGMSRAVSQYGRHQVQPLIEAKTRGHWWPGQ